MKVTNLIEEFANDQKIIAGDFYLVLDLDKRGGRASTNNNAAHFLKTYVEIENLTDVWRHFNPEEF